MRAGARKLIAVLAAAMLVAVVMTGCSSSQGESGGQSQGQEQSQNQGQSQGQGQSQQGGEGGQSQGGQGGSGGQSGESGQSGEPTTPDTVSSLDYDGYYYDVQNVVLYLDEYGQLPSNYITKSQARDLGWSGGSVQRYLEGAAIGGDVYANRERLLPKARGVTYHECDIDTDGARSRGAKRLIYTDDGDPSNGCAPYYYTQDHYESFVELDVVDGEVVEL